MRDKPAVATAASSQQLSHLRPVKKLERRGKKFAAVDLDVAHVLGPHRGATTIYGFLASSWFEYAAPSDQTEGKKRPAPGDWVEVSYQQLMDVTGTRARDSIIRWLRILAEDTHPCLEGRCGDEHPLIVIKRQGQNRPNRYRKWRCGEDELVVRCRVRSQKLSESARRRVAAGEHLNGIFQARLASDKLAEPDVQLGLELNEPPECRNEASELAHSQIRKLDYQTSESGPRKLGHQTSESLVIKLPEVGLSNTRKLDHQTSPHIEKELKLEKAAAEKGHAAAIKQADEVDAVACEVVDAILDLAHRVEPEYTDDQAWEVALLVARAALELCAGQETSARALLLRAIADRRLSRARNPIGLLIRGVIGDKAGKNRRAAKIQTTWKGLRARRRGRPMPSRFLRPDCVRRSWTQCGVAP